MPRTRKKRTDAPFFDATVIRHNLRQYGWVKQEVDWMKSDKSQVIEWYTKRGESLLLAVHDNDTPKPRAVIFKNAGYGRAVYRLITGK